MHRPSVRRVHVRHRVQVEVQQPIEAHELRRTAVRGVQAGHEVVLQDAEAEAAARHRQRDAQHEQHQQRQELEAHVEEGHRAQLAVGLQHEQRQVHQVHGAGHVEAQLERLRNGREWISILLFRLALPPIPV